MTSLKYIIQYRTLWSLNVELVYEKKNGALVFSGSRKIPTLGSSVCRALRLGVFYPTEHQWWILFVSHTCTRTNPSLAARRSVTSLKCKNDVNMSHLCVFRIFWKNFSCFSNVKKILILAPLLNLVVSKNYNQLFV